MKWRFFIIFTFILGLAIYLTTDEVIETKNGGAENSLSQTQIKNKILNIFRSNSVQQENTNQSAATIKDWVKMEAQKMDTSSFDYAAKDFELTEMARQLRVQDIQILKQMALNPISAANERILSTYLLIRSSSQSLSALQELAASQLSKSEVPEPHSLDETQIMHEKALRRMAIDELFQRAIQDEFYRPQLAKFIESIKISELKVYAWRRFQQLFGENE